MTQSMIERVPLPVCWGLACRGKEGSRRRTCRLLRLGTRRWARRWGDRCPDYFCFQGLEERSKNPDEERKTCSQRPAECSDDILGHFLPVLTRCERLIECDLILRGTRDPPRAFCSRAKKWREKRSELSAFHARWKSRGGAKKSERRRNGYIREAKQKHLIIAQR